MIFKVCFNSQAVLIPGDASVGLISVTKIQHPDLYKNVECIIWSHHGSCRTGQEALVAFAPKKVVSIISSYPKSPLYLPRKDILPFLNAFSPLSVSVFPNEHNVWYCDRKKIHSSINSSCVFITSANRSGDPPERVDYI
ncbi:hypothetical protein PIROE2DRAFT_18612 [Piromyces sp. E2]|nr:hypothetical protein PIROE2DRAFT_18612 [Piromyces sp. E2]|eukprot:OUM56666.1 hypothetical protein PIROE2DRAFT_18612 [Piromyces sp. E2]